jgi:hypothetical protein
MNQDMIWQMLRYALLATGGITAGASASNHTQLIGALVMMIGTFLWGCYVKWSTKSVPQNSLRPGSSLVVTPGTGKVTVHS